MKDKIKKDRNKIAGFVPREFTNIPEHLKFDKNGKLFLQFDSGSTDPDRIIILHSEFKKNFFFKKCDTILIDGTFKSAP